MRAPLSTNPVDRGLLIQGAGLIWTGLVFGVLLFLFGIKDKNLLIGLVGIVFLFFAFSSVKAQKEILTMYNKISWYRKYAQVTFISGFIFSVSVPFEETLFIAMLLGLPTLLTGVGWPIVTLNVYKKHYTSLFGKLDV